MTIIHSNNIQDQDLSIGNELLSSISQILSLSNINALLIKYNLIKPSKRKHLHKTLCFLVLAIIYVKLKGLSISINDLHREYVGLCLKNGYHPVSRRTIERYLSAVCKDTGSLSEVSSKTASKSYGVAYISNRKYYHASDNKYATPLLSLICELIEQINLSSNLPLGYGDSLLKAINNEVVNDDTVNDEVTTDDAIIKKIIIVDGTNLRMPDEASNIEGQEKSCKGLTGTVARKLHLGLNLQTLTVENMYIGSGVSNERIPDIFSSNDNNTLFLADAGYIDFNLFKKINDEDNYFIIKARQNVNPKIISCKIYKTDDMLNEENEPIACNRAELIKELTEEDCKELSVNSDDFKYADLLQFIQAYNQEQSIADDTYCLDMMIEQEGVCYRVVRIFNPLLAESRSENNFCFLYNNLPQDKVSLIKIWLIYKARWQIENYFKGLKSSTGLSHWYPKNKILTDIFAYTDILAHLIKMRLGQIAQHITKKTYSHLKLARINLFELFEIINNPQANLPEQEKAPKARKARSKRAKEHEARMNGKYSKAYKFLLIMRSCICSNISKTNKRKLKSCKEVVRVIQSLVA